MSIHSLSVIVVWTRVWEIVLAASNWITAWYVSGHSFFTAIVIGVGGGTADMDIGSWFQRTAGIWRYPHSWRLIEWDASLTLSTRISLIKISLQQLTARHEISFAGEVTFILNCWCILFHYPISKVICALLWHARSINYETQIVSPYLPVSTDFHVVRDVSKGACILYSLNQTSSSRNARRKYMDKGKWKVDMYDNTCLININGKLE